MMRTSYKQDVLRTGVLSAIGWVLIVNNRQNHKKIMNKRSNKISNLKDYVWRFEIYFLYKTILLFVYRPHGHFRHQMGKEYLHFSEEKINFDFSLWKF